MYFYRLADSVWIMTIGDRIEERRKAESIQSQSELARRAGMSQSTLNGLINRPYRWSPHLPRIARELRTTVDYLVGDIDDPDEGAPPPPASPTIQLVTMQVALPSENALARMFLGLLDVVDLTAPRDELAGELAQLLPTALSQLRGRLTETAVVEPERPAEAAPVLASADREPTR